MRIVGNKIGKNRSIFCWLPSLMTIKYPEGRAFVLAWGFYTLVLKDMIAKKELKEPLRCASCGDEMDKDCPKCLKFVGITK